MVDIPIISVVGFSGTGKTSLLEKLIAELTQRGFRVGTVKHHPHTFEMDQPGKDSWRHKRAGSRIALISSPSQIGMVMAVDHDYNLDELSYFFSHVDIVLAEGYKRGDNPNNNITERTVKTVLLIGFNTAELAETKSISVSSVFSVVKYFTSAIPPSHSSNHAVRV